MPLKVTPFRKLASNAVTTSFTAKAQTSTKPSGNLVVDLFGASLGINVPCGRFVNLIPFGTAAQNKTFDMRLWGWSPTPADGSTVYWTPRLLIELNVVLGNIDASPYGGTNAFLADTLTIAKGDANSPIISPANDTPASVLVHTRGCELLEFDFDADAGASASTADNCLWQVMDQR